MIDSIVKELADENVTLNEKLSSYEEVLRLTRKELIDCIWGDSQSSIKGSSLKNILALIEKIDQLCIPCCRTPNIIAKCDDNNITTEYCENCGRVYSVGYGRDLLNEGVIDPRLLAAVFTFKVIMNTQPLMGEEMVKKLRERLAYSGYKIVPIAGEQP